MDSPVERLLGLEEPPALIEAVAGLEATAPASGLPTIVCPAGDGELVWMRAQDCSVLARPRGTEIRGETFARFVTGEDTFTCTQDDTGRIGIPFSLNEAYESYVTERWASRAPRRSLTSGQLNAYYRIKRAIPRGVQLSLRRALIRWQAKPAFPGWPFDDSVERLVRFYAACALRARGREEAAFSWFWPHGARAAAILTHDVEGAAGLANALRIAELEEQRGLRSSFNIVGDWYPIDWGILRELEDRGHEIGSHALYHDRSLFSSRREFERQLPELREMVTRLGAVGFRSPATHRVQEWLGELPIEYDTTVPLSDPYEPQPGGACTAWPFFLGDVVELPYTLPQDHTLFGLLKYSDASPWIEQMKRVKASFGLIQCVSHPDPGYLGDRRNEAIYEQFLDALRLEEGVWHALPRDVARWWRARRDEAPASPTEERGSVSLSQGSMLADMAPPVLCTCA